MSNWLNNKHVHWKKIVKPCKICRYCPYGAVVEEFPFSRDEKSCEVFGHDCPAFYMSELFAEDEDADIEELQDMYDEFEQWLAGQTFKKS